MVKLYILRVGGDCIYQQSMKMMHYEPDFFLLLYCLPFKILWVVNKEAFFMMAVYAIIIHNKLYFSPFKFTGKLCKAITDSAEWFMYDLCLVCFL